MGPADSRRIPRVPRYSGAASAPLRVSPTGLSPPMVTLSCVFGYPSRRLCRRSYNPGRGLDRPGLGSCAFARHYWRNHCYFLFLRVLRCFSSPRSPCGSIAAVPGSLPAGFPIRTSAGHKAFAPHRGFSQLVTSFFASESHRHPPCALSCFLFSFSPSEPGPACHPLQGAAGLLCSCRSILALCFQRGSLNPR